ncbi:MAG: hypothetical protein GY754_43710 [bacterium]|nr:hypothetical protein [bacterium]
MKRISTFLTVLLFLCSVDVFASEKMRLKEEQSSDEQEIAWKTGIPGGIELTYNLFLPIETEFSSFYTALHGLSVDYVMEPIWNGLALQGGMYFVINGHNKSDNTYVFFNSYSIGARYWFPKINISGSYNLYPFVGTVLRLTWLWEKGPGEYANFLGYGGDVFLGANLSVWDNIDVILRYNLEFCKVADDSSTDISGHLCALGVLFRL